MLRSVVAAASFCLIVGASFALTFTPLSAVPGNTTIETLVCDGSASATLTIDTPASDTVVQSVPFTLSGTINNVTQIDIAVDGNYSGTIPVSANQTTYSTQFTISQGTHTVVLTGNDVCQVADPSETVVLTFAPPSSQPGGGGDPTQPPLIGPGPTATPGGSGSANGDPIDNNDGGISDVPVFGPAIDVVRDVATALDFDATANDGGLLLAIARFALFTLGLGLLLFAPSVLAMTRRWQLRDFAVFQYMGGNKTAVEDPRLHDHIVRNSILLRLLGIVCIIIAFLI